MTSKHNAASESSTKHDKKLLVLDTNVLLHDPNCLFKFRDNDIFIPFVTLEELDNKKVGTSDLNRNARQATRLLEEITTQKIGSLEDGFPLSPVQKESESKAVGKLFVQGKSLPFLEHEHLHKNDNLYLSVLDYLVKLEAKKLKESVRSVHMVTKDINLRIKARGLGFHAEDYLHDHVVDDAELLYRGISELEEEPFENQEDVYSWKEGKKVNYKIKNNKWIANQFLHVTTSDKLYQVTNIDDEGFAHISPVDNYFVEKNHVMGINARTEEQQAGLALLRDPNVDFVALLGPAGTGKTLLTVACAIQAVMDKDYDEIIFTRATIPVGDDIGYLPGTEEEKMAPWASPLTDNIEVLSEIAEQRSHNDTIKLKEISDNKINIKAMAFMRGRTLTKKFLIIDEAQNLTPAQMKTLITRAGENTKVVCLGNLSQIDSPYLSETSSGLAYAVEKFKGWAHFGALVLTKGERSRLANEANIRL